MAFQFLQNDSIQLIGATIMKKTVVLALLFSLITLACRSTGGTSTTSPTATSDGASFSGFSASEKLTQIALLTNGPASDSGYNFAHNEGRQLVEKNLGNQVKTGVLENVQETADAERTMERLINSGVKVIIASSFGYQDSTVAAAGKHPDVKFLQAWGFKRGQNIGTYSAKMYEAWYLMGITAGRMTKTNKLGIVAAFPIPPMKWQIDAYILGARSVNPKATATVSFINNWFDPVLSSQATEALINQGHDVVCGVLDNSVGVAQAAERRGAWLIGHNADLSKFAPTKHLVGTRWLWGKLYEDEVRQMLDGTWKGGSDKSGGLREGYVGYTNFSASVPDAVQKEVTAARDQIISGALAVYAGPIKDNAGKERVPKGKTLTHDEVMAIDWLVEGVK
jgi:basic membrane protein A